MRYYLLFGWAFVGLMLLFLSLFMNIPDSVALIGSLVWLLGQIAIFIYGLYEINKE